MQDLPLPLKNPDGRKMQDSQKSSLWITLTRRSQRFARPRLNNSRTEAWYQVAHGLAVAL